MKGNWKHVYIWNSTLNIMFKVNFEFQSSWLVRNWEHPSVRAVMRWRAVKRPLTLSRDWKPVLKVWGLSYPVCCRYFEWKRRSTACKFYKWEGQKNEKQTLSWVFRIPSWFMVLVFEQNFNMTFACYVISAKKQVQSKVALMGGECSDIDRNIGSFHFEAFYY